jgi:hypothetical protein
MIVKTDKPEARGVAVKGGDGYSRCPQDGCLEVDRQFKNGGRDRKGETYLNWEIYSADRREGGCGASWAADTKQGVQEGEKKGYRPRWVTKDAAANRSYSMPSDAYRDNYERIFGHE